MHGLSVIIQKGCCILCPVWFVSNLGVVYILSVSLFFLCLTLVGYKIYQYLW